LTTKLSNLSFCNGHGYYGRQKKELMKCWANTPNKNWGPSWSWLYGSWIYNYLCNQCISPLKLWVRIPLRRCVLETTSCDKVYQWLVIGWWCSLGTPVCCTNEIDFHDITEILLKVTLNTINQTKPIKNWKPLFLDQFLLKLNICML
jgi:hypothetical protein